MPQETAEHFPESPGFSVTALDHGIIQEVFFCLQSFKASPAAIQNGSLVIRSHIDLSEIVGIDVFCMVVHFFRSPGNLSVEGLADSGAAFIFVRNGGIQGKKIRG